MDRAAAVAAKIFPFCGGSCTTGCQLDITVSRFHAARILLPSLVT